MRSGENEDFVEIRLRKLSRDDCDTSIAPIYVPYEYHIILQKHVLLFTYNTRYVISGLGQVQQQQVIVVFTLYSVRAWETDRAEEATISRAEDAGETRTMMMTMRCFMWCWP